MLPSLTPTSSRKNEQGFKDVASLIRSLIAGFAKESQEAKVEEDHSQECCAAFMSEFSQSRVEKVNEVEELQKHESVLSVRLSKSKEELASAVSSAAEPAWGDQTQRDKFYAPKLHKVPSKSELRTDDPFYVVGGASGTDRQHENECHLCSVVGACSCC